MIELPEAAIIAEQINQNLIGKCISRATADQSPHKFAWYTGDPAAYNSMLVGRTIRKARSIAGEVEITADDMYLLIGAGMRYHDRNKKLPEKHQLLLEFSDGTTFTAHIQMWGCIFCSPDNSTGGFDHYVLARQRPSPLSEAFNRPYFAGLFHNLPGTLSAKAFLATEQRIPGLGNGVLQDILWAAKIHPKRKLDQINDEDREGMFSAVKTILCDMKRLGGRDTEKDLFGQAGGYKTVLSKNTVGSPCLECGTRIKKEAYLGGSIYFCETCQKL